MGYHIRSTVTLAAAPGGARGAISAPREPDAYRRDGSGEVWRPNRRGSLLTDLRAPTFSVPGFRILARLVAAVSMLRPRAGSAIVAAALAVVLSLADASTARADIGSYIVVDAGNGVVVSDGNPFQPWYPASITKLMTAYVTFRAIRAGRISPNSPVVITPEASSQSPSKMGFKIGTVLTIDNAMKMMLVKSANDIAVAIGQAVGGGSEQAFVNEMNREARRLGMTRTHFSNPNGLPDDDQVTNARDMAILAVTILREFPEYRPLFSITGLQLGGTVIRTHNRFVERFQGGDGMKTGFICNAGFNVVATATRGGRTLVAVVLGAYNTKERDEFAARILTEAFGRRPKSPTLAAFPNPPGHQQPANRRAEVCGGKRPRGNEQQDLASLTNPSGGTLLAFAPADGGGAEPAPPKSYLEATSRYMRPLVPVFIGLAPGSQPDQAIAGGDDENDDAPAAAAAPQDSKAARAAAAKAAKEAQRQAAQAQAAQARAAKLAARNAPTAGNMPASDAASIDSLIGTADAAEMKPGQAPSARIRPATGSIPSAAEPGVSVPLNLLPPAMMNPQANP